MAKRKKRAAQRRKGVSLAPVPQRVANRVTRGDMGPDTPAQRQGKVVEDVTHVDDNGEVKKSPNGMKRARRLSVAETYHRHGHLSKRQAEAAQRLLNAWECNFKSPPPSNGDTNASATPCVEPRCWRLEGKRCNQLLREVARGS